MIPDLNLCHFGDVGQVRSTWPDAFVQTVVTSPPYLWLRDYGVLPTDWPEVTYTPMPGLPPITIPAQTACLGLEASPADFIGHIVHIFREVHRVLREDGTLWFNMGDTYLGSPGAQARAHGLKEKDLLGVPWRCAFALQADGWYLRSDVIWHKPNPMPESVQDRPSKAHEYFFLLSKSEDYYFDAVAIREMDSGRSSGNTFQGRQGGSEHQARSGGTGSGEWKPGAGRNKRTVWTVASYPYKGSHFATFPPDLIRPCVLAGTPEAGCCAQCRRPWRRVVEKEFIPTGAARGEESEKPMDESNGWQGYERGLTAIKTLRWEPACECGAGAVPAIALDPFLGSGTLGEVSQALGRSWLGIDLDTRNEALQIERTQKIGLI